MSDNIFREVDEELRSDRMRQFWQRFGPYIIGAAVIIVLAVAGNEAWKWWVQSNAEKSAALFDTALEQAAGGDIAEAQAALDQTVSEGSGSYPVLARFRSAALLAEEGDSEAARAAYDALSTSVESVRLRELALLYAAMQLVDSGDVEGVRTRLAAMLAPGHPMRNAAREVLGLAYYAAGDKQAAFASFSEIANDPQSSQDVALRSAFFIEQLTAEGISAPVAGEAGIEADASDEAAE